LLEVSLPCVADWSSIRQVIEKDHFYRIGEERGYGTPATVELSELASTSPDMFPLAAKPKHRRVSADAKDDGFHRAMDRLRLVVIEDRDALDEFLLEEEPWIPDLVFQSYVPGLSDMMRTVGVYADREHTVRAVFTGRKLRGYPADSGDCVVGENFTMPYPVIKEVHRIVGDLRLSGILEFEFKSDEIRDMHVLIEVTPRSWSWVGITSAMGAGLPWTAYADLTGRNDPTAITQSKTVPDGSVRYAKVIDDAINTLFRYGSRHPWSKGIFSWWSNLNAAPLVRYAEFQRDDPVVALVSLLRGIRTLGAWLLAAARRTAGDAVRAASRGSTP